MKQTLLTLTTALLLTTSLPAVEEAAVDAPSSIEVEIVTSMGTIVVALNAEKAPVTVENFLAYVDDSFYDGTIFHRVIPDFMIQGGGFTPDMKKKDTRPGIQNESDNGLENARGTIAMARTMDPHSATGQFFINHRDNQALNFTGKDESSPVGRTGRAQKGWGYAVFGEVVSGMDVVDAIAAVKTGSVSPFRDVPKETVTIETIRRKK